MKRSAIYLYNSYMFLRVSFYKQRMFLLVCCVTQNFVTETSCDHAFLNLILLKFSLNDVAVCRLF